MRSFLLSTSKKDIQMQMAALSPVIASVSPPKKKRVLKVCVLPSKEWKLDHYFEHTVKKAPQVTMCCWVLPRNEALQAVYLKGSKAVIVFSGEAVSFTESVPVFFVKDKDALDRMLDTMYKQLR